MIVLTGLRLYSYNVVMSWMVCNLDQDMVKLMVEYWIIINSNLSVIMNMANQHNEIHRTYFMAIVPFSHCAFSSFISFIIYLLARIIYFSSFSSFIWCCTFDLIAFSELVRASRFTLASSLTSRYNWIGKYHQQKPKKSRS